MPVAKRKLRDSRGWPAVIRQLREDLSDTGRPLARRRFAELIGVTERTVIRWEQGGPAPTGRNATILRNVGRAIESLGDMIYPEDRLLFFTAEHPMLLGMPPVALLGHDVGTRRVLEQIERAASGTFS